MPTNQTSKRIDRLEKQAEERGPRINCSWILDIIADVYQSEREAGKLLMREADYLEFEKTVLAIYG